MITKKAKRSSRKKMDGRNKKRVRATRKCLVIRGIMRAAVRDGKLAQLQKEGKPTFVSKVKSYLNRRLSNLTRKQQRQAGQRKG